MKNMYWNLPYIISFNKNFNFINSKRGTGKTYTLQKWLIKEFLKKGKESIYITEHIKELDDIGVKDAFTKVLNNEYPEVEYVEIGHDLYLDGRVFCYGIALTEAQKFKKMSFPNVYYIMFDEYMKENNKRSFVKNRVDEFLSIYSTVDRYEDRVKCFLLGNTTTQYNDFHQHQAFNLPRIEKGKIWTSENVLYQYYDPPIEFDEKLENSRFANMIKSSEYGLYSVGGDFTEDTDTWVEKRTNQAQLIFTFIYMGEKFGVWRDLNKGLLYVSDKYNPSMKLCYSFTTEDHKENTLLTKTNRSNIIRAFITNFKLGNVRFENIGVKKKTVGAIKMLL